MSNNQRHLLLDVLTGRQKSIITVLPTGAGKSIAIPLQSLVQFSLRVQGLLSLSPPILLFAGSFLNRHILLGSSTLSRATGIQ